jgi:hypothetical protein
MKIPLIKLSTQVNEKVIISEFIKRLKNQEKLKYFKLINSNQGYEVGQVDYFFKDFYLDNKDLKLLSANSIYRLRFRWGSEQNYHLYNYLPFLSRVQPIRAEIQYKAQYRKVKEMTYAEETRFEFRKESEPFNQGVKLPSYPWYSSDFLEIAKTGMYLGQVILPYAKASEHLLNGLNRVTAITTKRYRAHITSSKHPWGSGPNQRHVFIISIDRVFHEDIYLFSEIEIEIDRNTLMKIEHFAKKITGDFPKTVIKEHSQNALIALKNDLRTLKSIIIDIDKEYGFVDTSWSKDEVNKYARIMKLIKP